LAIHSLGDHEWDRRLSSVSDAASNPAFWGLMVALVILGIGLLLIMVGLSRKRTGDLRGEPTRSLRERESEVMTPTGNAARTSLPSRDEGTWPSPGYRSARTRARWAQVLVGIAAVIYLALAITGITELSLIDRIIDGSATEAEVDTYLQFAGSLGSLLIIAGVISAIAVLAWLSRTVEIVPPLGGGTPHWSPREAMGWWFVPIASFFIPYQIVRDVYRRLETPTRRGGDGAILAWWLLFIIGGLVSRAAGIAGSGATTIDAARSMVLIEIATDAAAAVGGFLFVKIIGEIESRATERAVSLSLRGPDAVWPAQIEAPQAPASPSLPPAVEIPASSIEARLATLERLRSTGAITEEEFAARRNKILDEI
jgi:hypothetical protein